MTFEWALKAMRGGMKVRRRNYRDDSYAEIREGALTFITPGDGKRWPVQGMDILAEDWDEYKELESNGQG